LASPLDDLTARHLAKVVESSDDAIISKNLDSVITSWNPAAQRMFGYTEAEAVGQSIRMVIPDERQTEEDDVLAKIRAGEKVDHYETIRQRKNGQRFAVSLTVSPIRDQNGVIVGASKIARDISERVNLQNRAEEHAANTKKLGDVGAAVAATLDRNAIEQMLIAAAREMTRAEFGAFSATFKGEHSIRVEDVSTDPRHEENLLFSEIPAGRSVRSYLVVPVKSAKGDVLGGLFFGHSSVGAFTEQHEHLATGIAAWGSVALENARYFTEAQDANRMKDDFLAVLSHELRTPLNAILGYARMLRGNMLPPEQVTRGLETVERNARWLAQIVDDVLDVSRIVSGKIRLDVQTVELPGIVDNAVATVQPAADAKSVRLQTLIDPRVGPVSGDPDRLQQIMWNLLMNAVKFTPKGGRVQVRLERVNSHLELIVSDTGIGISEEFLPKVFERFRQADSGPTRKTGGLGLGLAIVRHLVEMHGGTVDAASAGLDQGSTFTVKLPLMIVQPSASAPREHPLTDRRNPLQELGNLTGVHVLAVDDEADALGLLKDVLEAAGAIVTTASSASAALDALANGHPQAMVADIGMPEMDGYELIRQVRISSDPTVRDIPAAALTAFARSEDRTRALQAGFEMHLAKPVDPGELVASVATLVRRYRNVK
jgi:PAS domain S-box-containing protein